MPFTRPRSDGLLIAALLTALVALGPISTDLYLPSLPAIGRAFGADAAAAQLTLSAFIAGMAVAQLIYGPLSDRFGRRPILLIGLAIYGLASLACAVAPSIEFLIAMRFLQAVGACVGPVVCRAVVRDIYGAGGAARVLSYLSAATALGPLIGPIVGGYLEVWFGWRSNFVLLLLYGVFGGAAALLLLSETNQQRNPRATEPGQILAIYLMLLGHRRYLGYLLSASFAYGGIFSFLSGSSFVLVDGLGLSPDRYGIAFALAVTGYIAGALTAGRLSRRVGFDRLIAIGGFLALASAAALLIQALAGLETVAGVVGTAALFLAGTAMVLPNSLGGAIGPFPRAAGAASALLGFVQMGLAALIGLPIGQASDGSALAMAIGMAACAAIGPLCYWALVRGHR